MPRVDYIILGGFFKIFIFPTLGRYLQTSALKFGDSFSGKLSRPSGCIFHQKKFIFFDRDNNCLKVFDRSGKFLRKIGEQGKGDGQSQP